MKKYISLLALLILFVPALAFGQQINIEKMTFAESIEDRTPMNADTTFSANVGSIFCFTKVTNATDTTQISHVWYYEEEEKARIPLDVKSKSWRTWSSKKIIPKWTGEWSVKVEDASGNVLKTKSFSIQ